MAAVRTDWYWTRARYVVALEYAVGRESIVVGKPSLAFFEAALGELGVDATATAMIGDDIGGPTSAARWTRASTAYSSGPENFVSRRACERHQTDTRPALDRGSHPLDLIASPLAHTACEQPGTTTIAHQLLRSQRGCCAGSTGRVPRTRGLCHDGDQPHPE